MSELSLQEVYEKRTTFAEGVTMKYRGYELRKTETVGLSPAHSEWGIFNRDGDQVESFTIGAFDDFQSFQERLDTVIDYDPKSIKDWLNREE
jgi:hypothetical protein